MGAFRDAMLAIPDLSVYLPLEELGTATPVNLGTAGVSSTITHYDTIGQQGTIVFDENYSMRYTGVGYTEGLLPIAAEIWLARMWCKLETSDEEIISFGNTAAPAKDLRIYVSGNYLNVDLDGVTYTSSIKFMYPNANYYIVVSFLANEVAVYVNKIIALHISYTGIGPYFYNWFKLSEATASDNLVDEISGILQDESGNNLLT